MVFTALPAPGERSSLPTRIVPDEALRTQRDWDSMKVRRIPKAPRSLPVVGVTPYEQAVWWHERLLIWKVSGALSFDSVPNAHCLWVIGQLCPSGEGPWREQGHLLSLGYGVALGHVKVDGPQVTAAFMAAMSTLEPLLDSYNPESRFRLSERFPR